jgi:cellulose synthase (UDP-forming)
MRPLPLSIAWAGVMVGAIYLVWRAGWTVNTGALWLALPLLAAEIHGYLTFLLFFYMTRDIRPPRPAPAPPGRSIDFFIPTYNEPYEVLATTVAGAAAVRYPHTTYVLDDGRRPWVERLCAEFGVQYITRPDNAGAKAGNINHALARTRGEIIAIVDADFVPAPTFIDDLLGYFTDPETAIVQAPQAFYNADSFQHALGDDDTWHEQRLFYEVIQPGKNRFNAAFWSGAPSMVRRSALESVGGVRPETVTEDLHTSLKVHQAGWKTVFHPGVVALGLAPDDFNAFIGQRLRWAQGAMQVIRREWRMRGLTLPQRLNYIASTGTYFDAYRKAVMLLIVPAVLFTDQLPIATNPWLFFAMWALQFGVLTAANAALGRGQFRPLQTEFFDLLKMFAFISAGPTLLSSRPLRFKVTPKGEPGTRSLHPLLMPFWLLLGLYAAGNVVGLARLAGVGWHTDNVPAMLGAIVWGIGLLVLLAVVTVYGYRHVNRRRVFRISLQLPAVVTTASGEQPALVCDATLLGLGCRTDTPLTPGERVVVSLTDAGLVLPGVVQSVRAERTGSHVVGIANTLGEDQRVRLASFLAAALFTRDSSDHAPTQAPSRVAGRAA